VFIFAGLCFAAAAGCQVLQQTTSTATSAVSNPGMSLLAAFHPSEVDKPGLELSLLKPDTTGSSEAGVAIGRGDVLEITIQDLYEPGKPHTVACRVDDDLKVELPLIGSLALEERTCPAIEKRIATEYRNRELLKNPVVVVRGTEPSVVTVNVTGAVVMPGPVRLLRSEATVFSAIAQSGGGRANAGKQISITRVQPAAEPTSAGNVVVPAQTSVRAAPRLVVRAQSPEPTSPAVTATDGAATQGAATPPEEQSADSSTQPPSNPATPSETPAPAMTDTPVPAAPRVEWFHLDRETDIAALKKLQLEEGDVVHITATTLPVRVMGHVERPGPVQVPPGRAMTVWDVMDEAGGLRGNAWPVGVTLYRPTSEAGRASQYSWTLESPEAERPTSELVRPGDIVYVAPSAGARIKNAVGGLWKP
jgi:protein involved in polysaccharide export with SLBB domain